MGEVVNLRMARKRASRKIREDEASANRALHSIPGKLRREARDERAVEDRRLEGHRIGTTAQDEE